MLYRYYCIAFFCYKNYDNEGENMKTIRNGIVFSNDIKRILEGVNSLDFRYDYIPNEETIKKVRYDFKKQVERIFEKVSIISEEEMLEVNNLIEGGYPHRNIG